MALKVLLLRNKLSAVNATLAQLREQLDGFETRESELAADIEAAQTNEERAACETAIGEFEADRDKCTADIEAAEAEARSLTEQIEAAEANAAEARGASPAGKNQRGAHKTMPNHIAGDARSRFYGMTYAQRDAFFAREDVTAFLARTREMLGQQRAVSGAALGIPEVMLDIIRDNINRYSKLIGYTRLRQVRGKARQNIVGTVPEAVWTEMVGTLNELTISISQIETDGYKVGGYVFVSNCYLEDDDNIGLATEILDQLGQAIGYALDKAILFGTGTKMPVGIATRLAAAEQPAWWGTNQGTFTALATTNVIKANSAAKNGEEFYADLITALGAADPKYSNGTPVWVCNHKTHVALQCKALAFDGAAALTAGVTSEMPIIGGKIVELDFVPDNEIIGGYMDLYLLAEREGTTLEQSREVKFIEDQTAFKASARYDGKPVRGEAFVVVRYDNVAPVTSVTFATDSAN
nr:MAG TPA_asm: major capsid protein [Bacteriophage sp.]